jgi:hypothetical protein
VFDRLKGVNLKLKPTKCNLFQKSEQGINTDPDKVKAVRERNEPRCLEDVRSFLVLVGYYRSDYYTYSSVLCYFFEDFTLIAFGANSL